MPKKPPKIENEHAHTEDLIIYHLCMHYIYSWPLMVAAVCMSDACNKITRMDFTGLTLLHSHGQPRIDVARTIYIRARNRRWRRRALHLT